MALLSGCAAPSASAPTSIRFIASHVMPYQPSNSVWYSFATLQRERPFARWEQDRDRIELVTWPKDCAHVPVAISFTPGGSTVRVETGRAPRSEGPRQCAAGRVLTSTFVGSRALRRDRPTTLLLDGRRVTLPAAPAMVVKPAATTVSRAGIEHHLRQLHRPLPQYSVRNYPWNLTSPASPSSSTIGIGWIGGSCDRNASIAYVVETATTVTIDTALAPPPLRQQPAGPASAITCAGVGLNLSTTIRLQRPLGSRTLLQHQYVQRPAGLNAF